MRRTALGKKQVSKLPRQLGCLLLPVFDHVQGPPVPGVLNGHRRDAAHADEAEPEFDIAGDMFKTGRSDRLKAGLLALAAYIRHERLVDIQRRSILLPVKREKHVALTGKIDQ